MKRKRDKIKKLFRKLDQQEKKEKEALLKEHWEKWRKIHIRQREMCEKHIGHEFRPLPVNGWNRPNWDGTWPEQCWICDKQR